MGQGQHLCLVLPNNLYYMFYPYRKCTGKGLGVQLVEKYNLGHSNDGNHFQLKIEANKLNFQDIPTLATQKSFCEKLKF